ncbi:MAG: phosphoglycerate kinase [Candidatus Paceibacterota bacterium]|jgi:phosphoglycerate kinase
MKTLKDIQFVDGIKVLMRADFNVPLKNGVVANDYRIRMTIPSIEYLLSKGAVVILMSHLEADDGSNPSLQPVANRLNELGVKVSFIKDYKNAYEFIESESQKSGKCFLLENLRFFDGEKGNDPKFSKELASLADIYVNDAFSVCHRKHASIVGVPKLLDSYAGLQLEKEISYLSKAFNPTRPFLFILGGAKFDTKLPLFEKFMKIADFVFVGGALANDFLLKKGYEVGESTVSKGDFELSQFLGNEKLLLPSDVLNEKREVKSVIDFSSTEKMVDVGPKTLEELREVILKAKSILWNGPLGRYEDGFQDSTLALAKIIGEATENDGVESIVGGGDTLAAIATLGIESKFTFVSTGGGAMLDFLANGTLVGIEVLK